MKGDEAGLRVEAEEEGGDVAVADEHLGVLADDLVVEEPEDAGAAPAALHGDDAGDAGVGEGGHEVGRPVGVLAAEIAIAVEKVRPELDLESQGFHVFLDDRRVIAGRRGARGADQGDRIAGAESPGLERRDRRGSGTQRA